MSESQNVEEESVTFLELYEYNTRNLAGCDNDDSCCTFPKGYVFRQALYHCLTCREITGKEGGICYPCSVHCHADHILEDLYTKRNFRCDCGNSNFPPEFRCKLWEEKDDINLKNKYNHNFTGRYCVCNGQYDETQETEEMIQCIVCEDWYHLRHLLNSEKDNQSESISIDKYEDLEFICKLCLSSHHYLEIYNQAFINKFFPLPEFQNNDDNSAIDRNENNADNSIDNGECQLAVLEQRLNQLQSPVSNDIEYGAFWPSEFRDNFCRCPNCKALMEKDETQFLLDVKDTIVFYYNNPETIEEDLQQEMANLPFSQAIRVAEGVRLFKRHLSEFMNSRDPNKVITAEDVNDFFDNIKRKRIERYD